MSWFSFADIAKNALNEAQKKIDQALDIQGKDDKKDYPEKSATSTHSIPTPPDADPEIKTVKRADFGSKRKANVNTKGTKTVNSTPPRPVAKKDSAISDDFFSVLGEENFKPSPRNSKTNLGKFKRSDSDSKLKSDGLDKEVADNFPESCSQLQKPPPDSEFTDIPLEASPEDKCEKHQSTAQFEIQESEFEEQPISSIDNQDIKGSDSGFAISEQREISKPQSSTYTEQNLGYFPTIVSQSDTLNASDFNAPEPDRGSSPAGSTAASSEIDILDHESTVSEASRCNDGPNFILSPLHLRNTDNVDSDASQALSPVHDEMKGSNASSPTTILTDEACVVKDTGNSMPSHSFQPVEPVIETSLAKIHDTVVEQCSVVQIDNTETESTKSVISTSTDEKVQVMSEKMEVYEQQLINLSKKNAQLNEENDNLRSEIIRAKEDSENESRKELEKISNSVKSYETNNKMLKEEKTNLVQQISVLKSQLASRMTNEQVQNAIAEKEESIKGLMEEGETLAKKHLQQNNLIKKLKSQAQDREAELKTLREKVTNYEAENTLLKDELKLVKGQGKEERETSLRISDAYEQRERETQLLQEKLSQSEEKQRTLQANLDSAYKEIGDLHKQIAEQESKTLTEWKDKEVELSRENEIEKKKIVSEHEHQRQLLMLQIMELNNSVARAEAASSRKDDDHRREIKELQQRLQESEARNQDLSDNVSSATRPLLRQIENLQATHSSQQRSWNALEKTLNSRLGEAQAELLAAQDNERIAQSVAVEAKSKAAACEKHIENYKSSISQRETDIESLEKQVDEFKSQTKLLTEELEELKVTHKETVHKSRKERLFLENQLQMEKVRSEAERKKHSAQQEALQKEKDRLMWSRSEITSVSSNQVLETESVDSSNEAFHAADSAFEKQLSSSSLPGLNSQLSFEGGKALSLSNVLENLQSQLKLKDGEIAQLKGEINMLERTRSSMAEEIVRLTNLNEDLEGVSKELQDTKEKLTQVESRYSAILTMYGEKEEENEELKMDLADVKAMYRQQINDLLKDESS